MSLLDADSTNDQLVGTIIDDRFEVLELIGRGGNGLVYKARQTVLNRVVAIKVLHWHLLERQSQDRFRQELRTISTLSHPNILSLYSAGALASGQPYMVLEYLHGQTLADAIKAGLRWPDKRCLPWLKQVLSALEYAHVNGVIHRDLKPSNVVLTESDDPRRSVRLVDFGIARVINLSNEEKQRLTQTGAVFGTPLYMSPEQCEGKQTDPRSDIYAFGCLMYETLTGKPPFDGG
jgi:eukaryotic-like serine/threonine-protein kinase